MRRSHKAIRKAVIPAAGFGTRMLPATKAIPKEMLPIVDIPTIQYVVEEAIASGLTDILMVIGKGKRAIEDHFDSHPILEQRLEESQKEELLDMVRSIGKGAQIHFVWQKELNGLGDAVNHARNHVGDEAFMVLLGDCILRSNTSQPVSKQLIDVYEEHGSSVIGLERVDPSLVYRYGVVGGKSVSESVLKVDQFVEKPPVEKAPSNLVIAARYLLTPEIFDYLEIVPRGVGNEIQLTDAMALMLKEHDMYALEFDGKRYDIGNKLNFIKTNLLFGLEREDMREELQKWVIELAAKMERIKQI
ncbi:MAG: UTP--glucose-1-phosphate uridylyltransferase GalU [Bacteroidia bacterium]|nr:UTP--glucose-1-phosphate uridylyltransferase GalU [Bacteroidia bacterium]